RIRNMTIAFQLAVFLH
ncbi:hypothetical protein EE612_059746, partial [Oryza sativa]